MEYPSDRKLWEQTARSDAAFAELFERHAKAVYNYCFRRVGKWDLAEDLMAATFLEAWRRRDEIQLSGESLRPWLLGTATNLMRNQRRSARRRDAALQRVQAEMPRLLPEDDAADRLDDERRMHNLLNMVADLPEQEQEALALVVWSDLSYEEAGLALGIPVGTVKSRVARARRRLRELSLGTGHYSNESSALAGASITQPSEDEG
ncbi:MAG TPA: RNA polymerase sigma factor [Actinomycetota bacterium]|nr:RNA polymerase sigma factor [Actinomycetota bacterium]